MASVRVGTVSGNTSVYLHFTVLLEQSYENVAVQIDLQFYAGRSIDVHEYNCREETQKTNKGSDSQYSEGTTGEERAVTPLQSLHTPWYQPGTLHTAWYPMHPTNTLVSTQLVPYIQPRPSLVPHTQSSTLHTVWYPHSWFPIYI